MAKELIVKQAKIYYMKKCELLLCYKSILIKIKFSSISV